MVSMPGGASKCTLIVRAVPAHELHEIELSAVPVIPTTRKKIVINRMFLSSSYWCSATCSHWHKALIAASPVSETGHGGTSQSRTATPRLGASPA
jgi:hypothetical protein